MVLQGLTVGTPTRETIVTMEGWGGKGRRAIKGDEQRMVQNADWVAQGLRLEVGTDLKTDGVKIAWRNRSEARADGMVARAWCDAAAGLSMIVSLTWVALALGRQKRRRWPAKEA
jgi:hypothetical protein